MCVCEWCVRVAIDRKGERERERERERKNDQMTRFVAVSNKSVYWFLPKKSTTFPAYERATSNTPLLGSFETGIVI